MEEFTKSLAIPRKVRIQLGHLKLICLILVCRKSVFSQWHRANFGITLRQKWCANHSTLLLLDARTKQNVC